ncbi:MAG TPA: S9 family peptidase, partial [Candidatus Marinimicrobia bacterium]|nr:S9 family peptidase [Candidatus Neomarinimicrobiota bacterium]
ADGAEFIIVDPKAKTRKHAFDHQRLADVLSNNDTTYQAFGLPFRSFEFTKNGRAISFDVKDKTYTCNLRNYGCTDKENKKGAAADTSPMASFRRGRTQVLSPNGKLAAFIRDHNLWVRNVETKKERQLTFDGIEDYGYATNNAGWTKGPGPVVLWSPDSKKIATFQHDSRGTGEMYMVSTKSGHPELSQWKYPLPGDSLIFRISRVVINVKNASMVRLNMPPDQHRSTSDDHIAGRGGTFLDVRWSKDAKHLAFVSSSRDHKEAQLRVADTKTGKVRDVMKEVQETYFESGDGFSNWHYLSKTNEVIWFSERDNWGHLYLIDLKTGKIKNRITQGEWAVQQVRYVDQKKRKIYFSAGGKEQGDPYYWHYYSINIDGSDLKLLTPEYAHHTVTFSSEYKYFIDSYSTPVTPPITVLRDMDGNQLVKLEQADISRLVALGWQPPTQVKTKARDGVTDIYGLLYKPTKFNPNSKYPVLNPLYPGPQSGSVGSRSFRPSRSDKQSVAELGFIVIEVDAMGTPGRSKSFHDAYYGNMGDNGLPDQVEAIKQLGAQYPWMDLDRVGIYGGSGGGFASTGGILRYPDFYKVAVSGSGNHDNATYEDDWGEKWQGMLIKNEDGSTTYDNQANHLLAENLKGKLLLGHGSLDGNVPVNNTLLVAKALMDANKDFDLLIFPNKGHGLGQYWMRRRWDYFVRHLKGTEPPKEFEFGQQSNH